MSDDYTSIKITTTATPSCLSSGLEALRDFAKFPKMNRALGYSIDTLQRRVCSVSPRTTVGDSEFAGSIKLADSATVPVLGTSSYQRTVLVFLFSREVHRTRRYIYLTFTMQYCVPDIS